MHPYLPTDLTKNLSRYKNFICSGDRELRCRNEPSLEEWKPLENIESAYVVNPTHHNQINEHNNIKL